jgi:hypothetical protein
MSQSTAPIGEFDVVAGAKAGYERFYANLNATPNCPWDKLTQARQNDWIRISKACIMAAKRVKSRKEAARTRRRI